MTTRGDGAAYAPITRARGDNKSINFTVVGLDLSGDTLAAEIAAPLDTAHIAQFTVGTVTYDDDTETSSFSLGLSSTAVSALSSVTPQSAGGEVRLGWDLKWTSGSVTTTLAYGPFIVVGSATND